MGHSSRGLHEGGGKVSEGGRLLVSVTGGGLRGRGLLGRRWGRRGATGAGGEGLSCERVPHYQPGQGGGGVRARAHTCRPGSERAPGGRQWPGAPGPVCGQPGSGGHLPGGPSYIAGLSLL